MKYHAVATVGLAYDTAEREVLPSTAAILADIKSALGSHDRITVVEVVLTEMVDAGTFEDPAHVGSITGF